MTPATPQGAPQSTPLAVVAVLPARIGSTRLPRKVLLSETGLPLFVHTAQNVARCAAIQRVLVATDSEEVRAAGAAHGVEVSMTDSSHPCGTDRVHEAVCALEASFDVVLNVQADEPDVEPADLTRLVRAFEHPEVQAATLATPIHDESELASTSVVKVVRDAAGNALYFSRSPVPNTAHAREAATSSPLGWRHVGVYAYRPAALARFCQLPVGELEARESLEQLRWLEAGEAMRVLDILRAPRGIDTLEDYREFAARLSGGGALPDLERTESR